MNLIKKFEVELVPSTLEVAYYGAYPVKLKFETLKFNDGSIRVKCNNPKDVKQSDLCVVSAYLQTLDDLMVVAQIKDIVSRLHKRPITFILNITSPVYSRYDRVMLEDQSDGFGSLCFANMVNSLNFNIVKLLDCHSEVLVSQINNCVDVKQSILLNAVKEEFGCNIEHTIAPDKGAVKKNNTPSIVYNKVRNLETGKIVGLEELEFNCEAGEYLVIDDLCEGGGTFLGVADKFNELHQGELSLYVTHGLFTNNAIDKLLEKYSKIYVYITTSDVYITLTDEQLGRVFPL